MSWPSPQMRLDGFASSRAALQWSVWSRRLPAALLLDRAIGAGTVTREMRFEKSSRHWRSSMASSQL